MHNEITELLIIFCRYGGGYFFFFGNVFRKSPYLFEMQVEIFTEKSGGRRGLKHVTVFLCNLTKMYS